MSIAETLQIVSTSSSATEQIGERLAGNLLGGEVIELVSDLGGGKTTFVRGLVRGLGSKDHVSSPTFTISNIYNFVRGSTSHKVVHFDFYRLQDNPGLIVHELKDELEVKNSVVVIEWGEVVKNVLPKNRLTINIQAKSENMRNITFEYPKKLKYLMVGI